MEQTRLDAIRARCERATPGPWTAQGKMIRSEAGSRNPAWQTGKSGAICNCFGSSPPRDAHTPVDDWVNARARANARFIAAARADMPDMLAEIERLTAALKLLESDRDAERKMRLAAETPTCQMSDRAQG